MTRLVDGLANYRADYGGYPTGPQAQTVAALRGENPRHILYFEISPKSENKTGEFVDPWGNPYHIILPKNSEIGKVKVYSDGRDGRDDKGSEGSDDIRSWD